MDNSKKYKVFIVDDDGFLLNMYSMKFRSSGFEVATAADGEDSIKQLKDGLSPDIMLIDMVMPAMNGIETLAEIRKEKLAPNAKVVILSNQSDTADIEQAKKLGIDGYIVKATTIPSEVVTEVQKILKVK